MKLCHHTLVLMWTVLILSIYVVCQSAAIIVERCEEKLSVIAHSLKLGS